MKINMPVTDNEISFSENDTLLSTTDLKGTITYVSQEFITVSGFSEEELIGENHNMVRHPDMPPELFEDLWNTLKSGKPWVQVIKNRCKNGDYYWVKSNITPVLKDGNVVEYMSVRVKPTREEIANAEIAIKKIKDGKLRIENGNLIKPGVASLLAKLGNIKLTHQFIALGLVFTFLVATIVVQLNLQKEDVNFSSKELLGVEYIKPLRVLLELTPKHRGMTNAFLKGDTSFENKIRALRGDIRKAFTSAKEVDERLGRLLDSTQSLKMLSEEWESLESRSLTLTPAQSFALHTDFIHNLLQFIVHIGDTSNLILDPKLESFYNMDLIVNRIPQLIELMGRTRGLATGILAEDKDTSLVEQGLLSELTAELGLSNKRVSRSYNSSANASQEASKFLANQGRKTELAVENFINSIAHVRDGNYIGDSSTLFESGTSAISESFALYDQSVRLLETQLQRRIDNLSFIFYSISLATIISIFLVASIGIAVSRRTFSTINKSLANLASISNGDYKQTLEMIGNNELSMLTRGITSMRIKTGFAVDDATKKAAASTRIKEALDNVSANVMVADTDRNIIYMNDAINATLKNAEADIQTELPRFSVGELLGGSLDALNKKPEQQARLLETLTTTLETSLFIGGRTLDLSINPVINENNARLGTVIELKDRTLEVAIEKEIDAIVESAAQGDLSKRIPLGDKDGFFKKLSIGLNDLLESSSSFVSDIGQLFAQLADGDLTKSISNEYEGDFQRIKEDANGTVSRLTDIISQIREAANTVHTAANEIAQGNTDLSQRTEEQASSLEETASSMEEITATVKQSSDNASEANHLAFEAKTKAQQGGETVQEAVKAMKEILTSSNRINDIIGVIDEIAFQTNLLALNAAVEAARAGEQGRGFAVVAGEVRSLSKRSADAAKEIKDLIRDSVVKVETGSMLVNESGDTLGAIVHAVDQVAGMINEVSTAASEQSSGIEQINQAVVQMDEMTQQNAALVEEASAASEAMSEQASSMNRLIGFFKVDAYTENAPTYGQRQSNQEAIKSYYPHQLPKSEAGGGNAASFSNDDDWEDF
ncbi:methyl-accepting chemotaxis protein [Alkalimarinus alittae]|uniref:Methyl-accepting chemotaxis protein n=1 Tax=Alkalimarinus alittae TaxID=2961619 RepID=A0ABY6N0B8_9ALTE|nr:methyl-accepting chemotaxis protein [Alkalimarinus alittae]UZE95536.1 methyl-accepting chemotaxis protein [Alkalimarinus alittae]